MNNIPTVVTQKNTVLLQATPFFLWVNYALKCNVTPKKVLTTKSRYMYSTILFSVALSLTIHLVQYRVSVKLRLQRNFVDFFNFSGNKVRCATTHCGKPLS